MPGNPILRRELLDRLRSWKTVAALLCVALVSSGLVLLRWPSDGTIDRVSQGALLVFRPLAFALTLAVMMLVPPFPGTSLVNERRRGTLALLLNSPTTPLSIYWGKLASNVLLALILISASLPAIAACLAMGGITLSDHILPLVVVLAIMAVQYTALGLWISLRSSSADASLRWTYAAILGLTVLSLGPLVWIGNLSGPAADVARWLTALSPVSALQQVTASQAAVAELGIHSGWVEFTLLSLLISGILAVATLRQLDPRLLDRPRPVGKIRATTTAPDGRLSRWNTLVDPHKRPPPIPAWLNPVMVKEYRTRKFGRLHWLIRLVLLCAIVSLSLTILATTGTISWGVDKIAGPLVLLQLALLLLVGPSLGANLIAAEVESGGWLLLRTTPYSAVYILWGKLLSVLGTMLLILLATLPGYAVMSFIQPAMSGQVSNVLISLLLAVALVVSISACISACCKTTTVATATSYGVLLLLFAGTLLVWLARGQPFGPLFVERLLLLNPAATALSEMQAFGFEQYRLAPTSWYLAGAITIACLCVLAIHMWRMTRPD